MPHSSETHRCPYCGRALRPGKVTCPTCEDLPALDPLDDRYLLTEEE